jgi:hypothetical protein
LQLLLGWRPLAQAATHTAARAAAATAASGGLLQQRLPGCRRLLLRVPLHHPPASCSRIPERLLRLRLLLLQEACYGRWQGEGLGPAAPCRALSLLPLLLRGQGQEAAAAAATSPTGAAARPAAKVQKRETCGCLLQALLRARRACAVCPAGLLIRPALQAQLAADALKDGQLQQQAGAGGGEGMRDGALKGNHLLGC